jgi:hypothetical protein
MLSDPDYAGLLGTSGQQFGRQGWRGQGAAAAGGHQGHPFHLGFGRVLTRGDEQPEHAAGVFGWHRQVVCLGVVLPGLVVVAIATRYKGCRYPIEVIGHAVWLYHRFALSLRDVDELMLARGVAVTTRRSGLGAPSSGRTMLPGYVVGDPVPAISGTLTRCS